MKNKGFTLIELLGVIIILALLMIIVFPSIVNSVKNSSNKTDDLTKQLIYNAAALFIDQHVNDFPRKSGGKYSIELSTLVGEGLLTGPIKLSDSDQDITNNKCIQVTYNNGYKYELRDSGTCTQSISCTLQDLDDDGVASLSDIVTCGTESFYVMFNDDEVITMLSMYNLNVGDNKYPNPKTYGLQDEHVLGYVDEGEDYGGIDDFSSEPYWESWGMSYPIDAYDENSNLYQYVNSYENYLKNSGLESVETGLMTYDQANGLDCDGDDCSSAPEWIYSTTYWFGTANNEGNFYYIFYGSDCIETDGHFLGSGFGVRPVITISTSEIQ